MSTSELEARLAALEAKLDRLLANQEKQNQALFPPIWRRLLGWCLDHWLLVTGLAVMGYLLFEIYTFGSAIDAKVTSLQTSLQSVWEKMQFWK